MNNLYSFSLLSAVEQLSRFTLCKIRVLSQCCPINGDRTYHNSLVDSRVKYLHVIYRQYRDKYTLYAIWLLITLSFMIR